MREKESKLYNIMEGQLPNVVKAIIVCFLDHRDGGFTFVFYMKAKAGFDFCHCVFSVLLSIRS